MSERLRAVWWLLALSGALAAAPLHVESANDHAAHVTLVRDAWHGAPATAAAARDALAVEANAGNAAAAHSLATLHYAGIGLTADRDAALRWWQHAASSGHADAAFNAGLLLLDDPARHDEAQALLGRAAAQQHALACYALGTWLAQHAGADTDVRAYLHCAASQGYAPAQYNLGQWLAQAGEYAEARPWLTAAAPSFTPAASLLAALPAPVPATVSPPPPPTTISAPVRPAAVTVQASATRIHGRDWVLAQPPSSYTVVVSAAARADALNTLLEEHVSGRDSAWFLHRPQARQAYTAIVGVYADPAQATQALAELPAAVQRNQPRVRRFDGLQRELRASADHTAATTP